jgi:hypothetical protein
MNNMLLLAIAFIFGLVVNMAHGYIDPDPYRSDPDLVDQIGQVNYWGYYVNCCFAHADRPNPLQDLRDKGFSVIADDCKQAKRLYDEQLDWLNKMFVDFCKDAIDRDHYAECIGR